MSFFFFLVGAKSKYSISIKFWCKRVLLLFSSQYLVFCFLHLIFYLLGSKWVFQLLDVRFVVVIQITCLFFREILNSVQSKKRGISQTYSLLYHQHLLQSGTLLQLVNIQWHIIIAQSPFCIRVTLGVMYSVNFDKCLVTCIPHTVVSYRIVSLS